MNAKWILSRQSMLVSLLGLTMLIGSPFSAQADQGKWWSPKRGGHRSADVPRHQEASRHQNDRRDGHGYRAPAWRGYGAYQQGPRFYRPWQGHRVYRERMWLRSGWGYHGRPAYGWRYYAAPSYYYPRHIVYVRPVRFFVSVGAVIGGVHVHGDYSNADDVYGCNFCDAQFSSFHAYEDHVDHCRYAPDGYTIEARDWDQEQWDDRQMQDDRVWDREDED